MLGPLRLMHVPYEEFDKVRLMVDTDLEILIFCLFDVLYMHIYFAQ